MGRPRRSVLVRVLAAPLSMALALLLPASVVAHPLGNFTINHYAGLRVESDRVLLDVVIDQAEIPTFQARFDFDLDGDATLSDEEIEAGRVAACDTLAGSLSVSAAGRPLDPQLLEAGLSFPLGVGGLSTMRQVCLYAAPLTDPVPAAGIDIAFSDGSFPERIGWREIVATGSGMTLESVTGELRANGVSDRLRSYPEDRIASPLADAALVVRAIPGGPTLPALDIPDAQPVAVAEPAPSSPPSSPAPTAAAPSARPGVVPGGVDAGELPEIFRRTDLTPVVILLSLAAAAALGAGHALTPGHGKTLMAAYLVGTRGSARHALGLGAAVSVSHTMGILALAALVVAATDLVAPDVIVRWAPLVAAVSIVLIGGWMLLGEVRRRRSVGQAAATHAHDHGHDDHLDHKHDDGRVHDHGHLHDHDHAPGSTITWRSLFLLGLAGGLIPSTSALLILLAAIAADRPAFGLVLVVAFGLGMAAVMSGIGVLLVTTRERVDRLQTGGGLARIREAVPLAASVVVLGFGLVLTAQALTAVRVV